MTDQPAPYYPQQEWQPAAPVTPPKKKRPAWILPTVIGLVILFCGVGIGAAGGKTKTVTKAGPTTHATTTATATVQVTTTPTNVVSTQNVTTTVTFTPVPVTAFTDGVFVVGTDIQPGIYKTAGGSNCYYARLSSLSDNDIISNGNSSGPVTIQVKATDKALQTMGGCAYTKVG